MIPASETEALREAVRRLQDELRRTHERYANETRRLGRLVADRERHIKKRKRKYARLHRLLKDLKEYGKLDVVG